jgi:hypothetical protein
MAEKHIKSAHEGHPKSRPRYGLERTSAEKREQEVAVIE